MESQNIVDPYGELMAAIIERAYLDAVENGCKYIAVKTPDYSTHTRKLYDKMVSRLMQERRRAHHPYAKNETALYALCKREVDYRINEYKRNAGEAMSFFDCPNFNGYSDFDGDWWLRLISRKIQDWKDKGKDPKPCYKPEEREKYQAKKARKNSCA